MIGAEGLAETEELGLTLEDGDTEELGETERETEALGLTLELGDTLVLGDRL